MELKVTFHESEQSFVPEFGEVCNVSDGGFERGYSTGYERGNADGYAEGYTKGVGEGYERGLSENEAVMDSIIENTCTSLVNDRIKTVNQYLCCQNTSLVEVNLPNVERVGIRAFQGCSGLLQVYLAKCTTLGDYAFQSCSGMSEFIAPELETTGSYALQSTGITSIVLPKLKTAGTALFYGAWKMHTCDLPVCNSITSTAFPYCSALTKLILRSSEVCALGGGSPFQNTPIEKGKGYIYVPSNLVEQYKTAANWSTYASQIKPLGEL